MSLPLDCSRCPKKEPGCEDSCHEWEKLHWSAINIKRCQYAYEREHGPRYPEYEKKGQRPHGHSAGGYTSSVTPSARQLPLKGKPKKRPVPAEFIRQKQREAEVQQKAEEWKPTPESLAARAEGQKLFEAIFGKR